MKPWRLTLLALLAVLATALSACGGDSGVPEGAVAVVDGTEISREELDELVGRARKNTESQEQVFPKVGTPEFQNIQRQYVAFLVQRTQFESEAETLGIEVSDKEVEDEIDKFVKSRFDGDRKAFEKALKEQSFTAEQFADTIRFSVLSQKLFDEVTKEVEVPEADILAYYQQNSSTYSQPASRDVRHILIAEKDGEKVDFAASKAEADRIHAELQNGADFAALAKQYSQDPGSKAQGGKLTISKGQTVPEFDKTSFELKQGVISEPVKTTYGYHIIEALSPVREASTTPLAKAKASIKATLLQERRNEFMRTWVEDLQDKYDGKTQYALGFEPPELAEETETDTETETTATE
jgi:parvulin-like peptidyl-prolyl isomerase